MSGEWRDLEDSKLGGISPVAGAGEGGGGAGDSTARAGDRAGFGADFTSAQLPRRLWLGEKLPGSGG